ncbi:MarR family winged helix-turn-helix transcriptional regulator [Calditrichota bacterium LG25]
MQTEYIDELTNAFTRLIHYFHHMAGQVFRLSDLSLAQYRVLMLLYHYQPMTVGQLKQKLGNAQSSVSEMLLRMEEQGLVIRDSNPKDRRQTLLRLSRKAKEMIKTRKEKMGDVYQKIIEGKSEEEIEELLTLLTRLLKLLEKNEHLS